MKIHNEFKQQDQAWFDFKLGKFGSTDAQAIMANGKGLETLAFEKVSERLTNKKNSEYTNPAMENGNEQEATARNSIELELGDVISEIGLIEHNDFVVCSPDGLIGEDGLIEIKCPTNRVFVEYMYYKKVDPKYYAQMQMQLFISERKWVKYAVFNPNFTKPLIITKIDRDEDAIKKIQIGLKKGEDLVKEIIKKI